MFPSIDRHWQGRSRIVLAMTLLAPVAWVLAEEAEEPRMRKREIASYNYVLGTQTIGVKYQFTDDTRLVETAKAIHEMGSNILKISMSKRYAGDHYGLRKQDSIQSLADLADKEPSFRAVFNMPFYYYHIWAYCFSSGKWADGLSEKEKEREYREMHAFAKHLLQTYSGSGKTFLLGHWEGDWHLHPGYNRKKDPPPIRIRGMIDWLNVRQKAIDDAKRHTPHKDVHLHHYTEVNLVKKALKGGKCLTNDVLPHVNVDYVSYSSYDTIGPAKGNARDRLHQALDYIESKLKPKAGIHTRRVFIGEYGFPLERMKCPERQDAYSRDVCRAALKWGCPFVLYWELYCNEIKNGKHRGFWLIDDRGRKQLFYHTLQRFYQQGRDYVTAFREANGRLPTLGEFRGYAVGLFSD